MHHVGTQIKNKSCGYDPKISVGPSESITAEVHFTKTDFYTDKRYRFLFFYTLVSRSLSKLIFIKSSKKVNKKSLPFQSLLSRYIYIFGFI